MALFEISPYTGFDMSRGIFPAGELIDVLTTRSTEHTIAYFDEFGDYAEEDFFGFGFAYNGYGDLVGGVLTGQDRYVEDDPVFSLRGADASIATLLSYVDAGDLEGELGYLFRGDDEMLGNGYADTLIAMGGDDEVWGGGGDDDIYGESGDDYLRGESGDDYIDGGDGHDDVHGNAGDDLVFGGWGDDWVVGGKDDDELYGEAGWDVVLGNLGHDYVSGGDGDDWLRGGQGDDEVVGGAGWDWISGDRGFDTLTGGTGADIFHVFAETELDVVTDFTASEGDRVYVLPGSSYTVAQSGADVVITVAGQGQMVLEDVQLSSLPSGWIFS